MANQDTTTTIYNDKYKVVFRNSVHRYYVDGQSCPGVTTIMGKVLAKPGLMLWPLNMAMRHLEGIRGPITLADLEEAKLAHVKRRDSGADTGTIVHQMAERALKGEQVQTLDLVISSEEVLKAIDGFLSWKLAIKPEVVAVEKIVYSPTLGYTGTFDSILEIDGKVYLCDLKTTNASREAPKGIYADYFIQLGAYLYAYEEQRQYELAHGGIELAGAHKLVKIDDLMIISCKKDGKVDTLTASELGLDLDTCMKMWTSTLFLYKSLKRVKAKIGGFE